MRKEKKKCVSLFILKHDSQLFPALKFTSWGISLSCWELPVSPVFLCYPLPTQTLLLPSLLLMLVPPPRKRFYSTQIPLPSLGAWTPTQPTCPFQRLHRVFYELWNPGLHLLPVWGCLSNWSVSLLTTASSIFTAQSRIWHVTGSGETSVQLLNEPAIFYLYMPYIKIPLFSASKYWVYRM